MKSSKHIFGAILLLVCFSVGIPSANALTISPVKIEVTGDPGQTLRGELELLNEQAGTKTFFSSFENFEPSGDTGAPKFVGPDSGLATWLVTEASVAVATGETVKVPYTITIPPNTEPGGYFAAIFWGEQDPATQVAGEVAIGGKLGVLILLRVAGDIVEDAGVSDFNFSDETKFKSMLPLTFTYRFSNSGGDRVVPLGNVTVTNTFGLETAVISANVNEGSVLPGSARKFQTVWGETTGTSSLGFLGNVKVQFSNFHFGLYKANLAVVYGSANQTAESSFRFFIFPWQLLMVCLLLLILVIMALKKYNLWIITKSKSNS